MGEDQLEFTEALAREILPALAAQVVATNRDFVVEQVTRAVDLSFDIADAFYLKARRRYTENDS